MKLSARNVLEARVRQVTLGAVNAEVILELPGGLEIVAMISKASAEDLALSPGKKAYAVIKATNVMVAVD